MAYQRKDFAELEAMSPVELLADHDADIEPGDHYSLGYGKLLVEALRKSLAATHAPASDEVLAELEQAYTEAAPVLWGVHVGEYDDVLIFEDENGDGYRPNPYHPICKMEDMGDEKQEAYAVLIKCLVNAAPALLARVRQAEAFKPQVVEVLATRRDAAHTLFTEELEENGAEGPIAGAEAADEISKIARALGLTLPETVKGGQ